MAVPRIVLLAAAVCLAAGCGKDGGTDEQVAGVVLEPREAIFGEVPGAKALVVTLVDATGACAAAQANHMIGGATSLSFALQDPLGGPIVPGTYPVWQPAMGIPTAPVALVDLTRADATCENTLAFEQTRPVAGSVTLEAFDLQPGGLARGRYDVQFVTGAMSGDFEAVFCALPAGFSAAALGCE